MGLGVGSGRQEGLQNICVQFCEEPGPTLCWLRGQLRPEPPRGGWEALEDKQL